MVRNANKSCNEVTKGSSTMCLKLMLNYDTTKKEILIVGFKHVISNMSIFLPQECKRK